jgi:glycosyltransferase involved in cell wall biosynthesis
MKVFCHQLATVNAICDYRIVTPMKTLAFASEDPEDNDVWVDDFSPNTLMADRMEAYSQADVVHCHAAIGVQLYGSLAQVKRSVRRWSPEEDCLRASPIFVQDWDDLYTEVDMFNPAFSVWGVKYPNGEPLEIGAELKVMAANGEEFTVWKDGEKGEQAFVLNVADNHRRIANLYTIMDQAHLVTCSTPRMKAAIEDLGRTGPIYVYPNSFMRDLRPDVSLAPHEGIRILWQGGYSHHGDLWTVKDSMMRLTEKYPNIKWVFFGHYFKWLNDFMPKDRYEYVPWVPFSQYHLKMATIQFDIAIAPLEKSHFNECKSAIKWYETSTRHTPAAMVAANLGPFADEIVDGETGLLYDTPEEFEAKMSLVIENARLRKAMGEKAKKWVMENRDADRTGRDLAYAYREAVDRHRAESHQLAGKSVNYDEFVSAFNRHLGAGKVTSS